MRNMHYADVKANGCNARIYKGWIDGDYVNLIRACKKVSWYT